MQAIKRKEARIKKKLSIRSKVSGCPNKPRLSVFRSLNNIYVQAIDDENGTTIASSSTQDKELKGQFSKTGNSEAAFTVGKLIAEKLIAKGVKKVVFDRNGYVFHGRVKSLAEGAREAGLEF